MRAYLLKGNTSTQEFDTGYEAAQVWLKKYLEVVKKPKLTMLEGQAAVAQIGLTFKSQGLHVSHLMLKGVMKAVGEACGLITPEEKS